MDDLIVYITVRSPFSYIGAERISRLGRIDGISLRLRPVYPLAQRQPDFFANGPSARLAYMRTDAERVAKYHGLPFNWPTPDPVVQDLDTADIAKDQPHIGYLTRLTQAACELGDGWAFYVALSKALFASRRPWTAPSVLQTCAESAGFDWNRLDEAASQKAEELDAALASNAKSLELAGHWGTPTMVFQDNTYFGQDRIALLGEDIRAAGYQESRAINR